MSEAAAGYFAGHASFGKRTRIDDLTVEIHVVQEPVTGKMAADLFGEIGPWEGESTEEIMGLLRDLSTERQVSQPSAQ